MLQHFHSISEWKAIELQHKNTSKIHQKEKKALDLLNLAPCLVLSRVQITNQFFKDLEKVASINRDLTLENQLEIQNKMIRQLEKHYGSNKKSKKKVRRGL